MRTLPAVSDAAAPGPSPDDAETEPTTAVPPAGDRGGADHLPTGEPDRDLVDEATEPIAGDGGEPDPEPPAAAVLAPLVEEVAGVRSDIATLHAGLDSLLPDLAATAREETLSTGMAALQRGVEELVRLTRRADEHVAELHSENQRLRAGELASATRPMRRDLVRLSDEVTQLTSASHPEARADLELVGSRLLDTLARWGLTPFTPAVGDPLDATRHQGVGRVASADGEPGTIASVRRPGFADEEGRAFRPAEVEVFAAPPHPADDTRTEE